MAWVTGRVVSTAGAPLAGVTVGDARRSLNVVTDRNGRYFLPVVRGARTVLSVLKPGFAPRTVVSSIAGLTGAADDAILVAMQSAAFTESGSDRWFSVPGVPVRVLVPEGVDVSGVQMHLAWFDHNDHFPGLEPEPAWVAGVHVVASAPLPAGTVLEITTAYGLPVATAIPGWRFVGDDAAFVAPPLLATAQVQSGAPAAVIRMPLPAAGTVLLGLAHDAQGPGYGLQVSERSQYRGFGEPLQTGPWSWLVDGRYLRAAALPRPPGAPTGARSPSLVYDSLAAQGRFVAEPRLYAAPWVTSTPTKATLRWSAGGNTGAVDVGNAWATRAFPLVLDGADVFGPVATGLLPLDYRPITEWGAQYAAVTTLQGNPGANLQVPTRLPRRAHAGHRGLVAVVSDRDSPYGSGWWPREVPRLVESPTHAGRWLYVTDGHGQIPSIADTLQPVQGAATTAPMRPNAAIAETDLGGVVDAHDTGDRCLLVTSDNPGAATGGVVALVERGTYLATLAGGAAAGAGGDIGDGGPATAAHLLSPRAAIESPDQGLVIADTGHHRVRRVVGGVIETLAGTGTAGSAGLGGPSPAAALNTPTGLATGTDGLLWIADTGNHRLVRVAGNGDLQLALDAAPNLTPPTLASPTRLCATETHLYLADTGNKRILRVDAAGTVTLFAGNGTANPPLDGGAAAEGGVGTVEDLALSADQELWFTESGQGRVWRIDAAGVTHLVAGGGSGGEGSHRLAALLEKPTVLALAVDGSVAWVAARIGPSANHRGLGVVNLADGLALQSSLRVTAPSANVRQVQRADGHVDTFDGDGSAWRFRDRRTASGTTVFAASWNSNGQPANLTTAAGTWTVSGYGTQRLTLTSQAGFETRLVRADSKLITFLHPDGQAHRFDTNAAGQIELDRGPSLYRVALAYRADGMVAGWSGTSGESGSLTKPACAPFGVPDAACLSTALECSGGAGCGGSCGQSGFCAAGQCALAGSPFDGTCSGWAVPEPAVCASPPCGAPTCSGGQDWSICAAGPPTCTACCCQGADCQLVLGLGDGCGCGGNGDCAAAEPGVGGVCEANPACGGGGGAGGADGGVSDVVDGGGANCGGEPQAICKVSFLAPPPGACTDNADCMGQGGPCMQCAPNGQCVPFQSTAQGYSCGLPNDVCMPVLAGTCGAAGCTPRWPDKPAIEGAVPAVFRHRLDGAYDFCVKRAALGEAANPACGPMHETRVQDRMTDTVGVAMYLNCSAGECLPVAGSAAAEPQLVAAQANLVARVCNGTWSWFAREAPTAGEIACTSAMGANTGWLALAVPTHDPVVNGTTYTMLDQPVLPHICPRSVCDSSRIMACDHQLGCRDSSSALVKANLEVAPLPAGTLITGHKSTEMWSMPCAQSGAVGSAPWSQCVASAACGEPDYKGSLCQPRICGPAGQAYEFMGCDGSPCIGGASNEGNTPAWLQPPLASVLQESPPIGLCRLGTCQGVVVDLPPPPPDPDPGQPALPNCSLTVTTNCHNPIGRACHPWSALNVRRHRDAVPPFVAPPTTADTSDHSYAGSGLTTAPNPERRVRYHVAAWPGWAKFGLDSPTANGSAAHPFLTVSQAIFSPRRIRCNELLPLEPGQVVGQRPTTVEIVIANGAVLAPPLDGCAGDATLTCGGVLQLSGVYGGSDATATVVDPCHLVLVGEGWQDKPVADPSAGHQGCLEVDNFGQAYEKCGMLNHRIAPSTAGCPLSPAWPPGGTALPNVLWNAQFAMFDVANVVVRGLNATPTTGATFYLQRNTRGVQLAGLRVVPLAASLFSSAAPVHDGTAFHPMFKAKISNWQTSIGAVGGAPVGENCEIQMQYNDVALNSGLHVLPPPTTGTGRFAWVENRAEGIDVSRCVLQGIEFALLSGDGYFSYFRDNIWRTDNIANRIRRLLFRNNYVISGGKEVQLYGLPMSARTYEWANNGQQGATDPWCRLGDLELPEWVRAWAAIRIQGNWFESALAGRSVQYTGPIAGAGSLDSATAAIGLAANVPALQGLTVKWLERQPGNLTHDLNPGEPPCAEWLGGFRGVQGAIVDNLDIGVPRAADLNALGPDEPAAVAQLRAVPPGNSSGVVSAAVPTAPGCVLHPETPAGDEPKIFAAPALTPAIAGGNLVRFGGGLTKLDRGGDLGMGFAGDLGSSRIGRGYSNRVTVRGNTIDHGVGAVGLSHVNDVEVTENRACDMMAGDGPALGGIFSLTVPADNVLIAANEVAGARNPCNVEPAPLPAWCNFKTGNGSVFHRQRATAFYLDPAIPVGMALDPTRPAPVRAGHNIAWRTDYGIVQTPVRESFRSNPLAAVSFYGTGQAGGVSPMKLNYQLPVTTDAAVTSGNLLGAAPYTHALVHRIVAPFTKGKVFPPGAADSQYGKFGWGWRSAGAQGDRIAVSTDFAAAQPCVDSEGQCSQCSNQGICICGDKGLCTMAGKRIFPYQQGILAGTNASAQSSVCQWASKEAWDASPQAKCIGKKPADGVSFKGVDANAVWLPFSQADARLGVRCCGAADEAMQLDDAAKVCPETVRTQFKIPLTCAGQSVDYSCSLCA